MARPSTVYVCAACGYRAARWMGKCPDCGAWNQLEEQVVDRSARKAAPRSEASGGSGPIPLPDVPTGGEDVRVRTGIKELDTALGGGLVAGSLVLLGGDPGVGKSTLLLTALDRFAQRGVDVLYVTGEESLRQVALRASRLGVRSATLHLMAETDFGIIEGAVRRTQPRVVVIDSVQVVRVPELESIPGTVSQVREVAHRSMLLAKQTGIAVLLVGHVTKSGDLAGPRVLEHLVDAVLHFEGDGRSTLRILRAVKNRFGPAGELVAGGARRVRGAHLAEVPLDRAPRLGREHVPGALADEPVARQQESRRVRGVTLEVAIVRVEQEDQIRQTGQQGAGQPGRKVPGSLGVHGRDRGHDSDLAGRKRRPGASGDHWPREARRTQVSAARRAPRYR